MDCRKFLCKTAAADGVVARNATGTSSAGGSSNQTKEPGLHGVTELLRAVEGHRPPDAVATKPARPGYLDWFITGGEGRTEMEDLLSKIPAAGVRG